MGPSTAWTADDELADWTSGAETDVVSSTVGGGFVRTGAGVADKVLLALLVSHLRHFHNLRASSDPISFSALIITLTNSGATGGTRQAKWI